MPEPLRPTMPKNSPWRISKETPSSACSSRTSRAAKGCTSPLFQRVDPLGRDAEGLVQVPRFDREGRGAAPARGAAMASPFVSLIAAADVRRARSGRCRASVRWRCRMRRRRRGREHRGDRRRTAPAAARACAGRRRTRSRPGPPISKSNASSALPRSEDQRSGTRPGSRRACGSSSPAASSSCARSLDPLLGGRLRRAADRARTPRRSRAAHHSR